MLISQSQAPDSVSPTPTKMECTFLINIYIYLIYRRAWVLHKLLKGTGDISVCKFQVDACCILLISPQHSLLLQDTHSLILLPVTS